jgi:hypothetical protein
MRVRMAAIVGLATIALLAGCTSAEAPASTAPVAEEASTPTPTPTPTPTVLTTYLTLICPSNMASVPLNAAWDAEDPAALAAAAVAKQPVDRDAALALDDPMTVWPAEVAEDIGTVRDELLGNLVTLDGLSRITTIEEAYAVPTSPHSEASQRIRLRLGLSMDTYEGCSA